MKRISELSEANGKDHQRILMYEEKILNLQEQWKTPPLAKKEQNSKQPKTITSGISSDPYAKDFF